jgi:hypothetical protein
LNCLGVLGLSLACNLYVGVSRYLINVVAYMRCHFLCLLLINMIAYSEMLQLMLGRFKPGLIMCPAYDWTCYHLPLRNLQKDFLGFGCLTSPYYILAKLDQV